MLASALENIYYFRDDVSTGMFSQVLDATMKEIMGSSHR